MNKKVLKEFIEGKRKKKGGNAIYSMLNGDMSVTKKVARGRGGK